MTGSRERRRGLRSGRTPLMVIATVFAASGLLRFGSEAGAAIAREAETFAPSSDAAPQPDISAVLQALREREESLAAREAALEDRLQALRLAEESVASNLKALEGAEKDLASLISRVETTAEADLAQLTAVYENMKAKEAGLVFERMSPDFAAGFLGRMRPDAAAAIMAGLPPDFAYSISVLLASRNAGASQVAAGLSPAPVAE